MRRRDYLKLSGAALAVNSMPVQATQSEEAQLQDEVIRLQLKHTWTTVMSSSTYRDTLHVQYGRDGFVGYGEGAPIVRYNETPQPPGMPSKPSAVSSNRTTPRSSRRSWRRSSRGSKASTQPKPPSILR